MLSPRTLPNGKLVSPKPPVPTLVLLVVLMTNVMMNWPALSTNVSFSNLLVATIALGLGEPTVTPTTSVKANTVIKPLDVKFNRSCLMLPVHPRDFVKPPSVTQLATMVLEPVSMDARTALPILMAAKTMTVMMPPVTAPFLTVPAAHLSIASLGIGLSGLPVELLVETPPKPEPVESTVLQLMAVKNVWDPLTRLNPVMLNVVPSIASWAHGPNGPMLPVPSAELKDSSETERWRPPLLVMEPFVETRLTILYNVHLVNPSTVLAVTSPFHATVQLMALLDPTSRSTLLIQPE